MLGWGWLTPILAMATAAFRLICTCLLSYVCGSCSAPLDLHGTGHMVDPQLADVVSHLGMRSMLGTVGVTKMNPKGCALK